VSSAVSTNGRQQGECGAWSSIWLFYRLGEERPSFKIGKDVPKNTRTSTAHWIKALDKFVAFKQRPPVDKKELAKLHGRSNESRLEGRTVRRINGTAASRSPTVQQGPTRCWMAFWKQQGERAKKRQWSTNLRYRHNEGSEEANGICVVHRYHTLLPRATEVQWRSRVCVSGENHCSYIVLLYIVCGFGFQVVVAVVAHKSRLVGRFV